MHGLTKCLLVCPVFCMLWYYLTSSENYGMVDDYSPSSFLSKFDFFVDDDPTEGYVDYVSRAEALEHDLVHATNSNVYLGVDHYTQAEGRGRRSVRLQSKTSYNHGLILLDAYHMPASICGVWPAFWTTGLHRPWPELGELDIIEGINSQKHNNIALHTMEGCKIGNDGKFTGWVDTYDCYVDAPSQSQNIGCKIIANQTKVYGDAFNAIDGGVYAIEWTSKAILVWFFPRGNIPNDIKSDHPAPSSWNRPLAKFSGSCDLDYFIRDQTLIFDITFCGGWASGAWSADPVCSKLANTCEEFVRIHPEAFRDAFWGINYLKVFQKPRDIPTELYTHLISKLQK